MRQELLKQQQLLGRIVSYNTLEKKEKLIKMQKETVLQELRKEKKRALLLLQNSLEQDDALIW